MRLGTARRGCSGGTRVSGEREHAAEHNWPHSRANGGMRCIGCVKALMGGRDMDGLRLKDQRRLSPNEPSQSANHNSLCFCLSSRKDRATVVRRGSENQLMTQRPERPTDLNPTFDSHTGPRLYGHIRCGTDVSIRPRAILPQRFSLRHGGVHRWEKRFYNACGGGKEFGPLSLQSSRRPR